VNKNSIAAEAKAKAAIRDFEEEHAYPCVAELRISHFVVEDRCPKCGEITATDLGVCYLDDVSDAVGFGCYDEDGRTGCNYEWQRRLSVDVVLDKARCAAMSGLNGGGSQCRRPAGHAGSHGTTQSGDWG